MRAIGKKQSPRVDKSPIRLHFVWKHVLLMYFNEKQRKEELTFFWKLKNMEECGKQHLSFWFCFCVAPFFSSVFSNFFCQVSRFRQKPPVSDRLLQVYRFIRFFSPILPITSLETISDSETVLWFRSVFFWRNKSFALLKVPAKHRRIRKNWSEYTTWKESKYGAFSGPQGYDHKRKLFRTNSFVLAHSPAKSIYIEQLTVKSSIQWL